MDSKEWPEVKLEHLGYALDKLPPFIARKEVKYFTGGALSGRTLANDDSMQRGPLVRHVCNGHVMYPTEYLLEYLEKKGILTIVVPQI